MQRSMVDALREPALSEQLPSTNPPKNPYVEARRAARLEKMRAWSRKKKDRPDRARAHRAVAAAIRRGELTRQPCEISLKRVCKRWPVEAHHLSYEQGRELEITWACGPCHRILSARARRKAERLRREREQG